MINRILYKLIESNYRLDSEDYISIFADPRSGSTWLAESLKCMPRRIIIDEPLHLTYLKKYGIDDFYWRQHIPESEKFEVFENYLMDLIHGKHMSSGLLRINNRKECRQANASILKIIRGKLLLPWFIKNLQPKNKPIFLIRNPYAAVSSAVSHPSWNYDFQEFKMPQGPFKELYLSHSDLLKSFKYKEEEIAFHWCLGNSYCLNHKESGKSWINIKYEDLLLNAEHVFAKLQSELGMEIPREAFLQKLLQPSSTRIGANKITYKQQLNQYKDKLSEEQQSRISRILAYFSLNYEEITFSYR